MPFMQFQSPSSDGVALGPHWTLTLVSEPRAPLVTGLPADSSTEPAAPRGPREDPRAVTTPLTGTASFDILAMGLAAIGAAMLVAAVLW